MIPNPLAQPLDPGAKRRTLHLLPCIHPLVKRVGPGRKAPDADGLALIMPGRTRSTRVASQDRNTAVDPSLPVASVRYRTVCQRRNPKMTQAQLTAAIEADLSLRPAVFVDLHPPQPHHLMQTFEIWIFRRQKPSEDPHTHPHKHSRLCHLRASFGRKARRSDLHVMPRAQTDGAST